jgi:hypothetical protein
VQVTGAGEELENVIIKEATFNRSPMPWGPLDPPKKLLIKNGHGLHRGRTFGQTMTVFGFFCVFRVFRGSF